MSKIEQVVADLAGTIAIEIGCEVVDSEFIKEGSEYYLRVFIDREESGVSLDDCEYVSKKLSGQLDESDPISQAYYLEVCSPGIDRKLKREKDFIRFLGRDVDVKLYAAVDGVKEFCGVLKEYNDGVVDIESEDKIFHIKREDAAWIKLAVKF